MIRETKKRDDLQSYGDKLEGGSASVSEESLGFILRQLSDNYSDPYGSIVRELTSNIFDTHFQTGKEDEMAIVGIVENYDESYVYFKDKGSGMTPEFIKNVYMGYGNSTKRNTNGALGCFGIGSKSPFSITDEYFIDSVVDGIKYSYIIFVDGDKPPEFDVISKEETDEENGTTVKILLKNNTEKLKFRNAFSDQLIYFNNVYVENGNFNNNYKIYNTNTANFSNSSNKNQLHICYGKVYYPIDFSKINLPPIYINAGLKFNIGELSVTPNRESIIYREEEIRLIRKKIKNFLLELIERHNNNFKNKYADDLLEYEEKRHDKKLIIAEDILSIEIDIVQDYLRHKFDIDITVESLKFKAFENINYNHVKGSFISNMFYLIDYYAVISEGITRKYDSSKKDYRFTSFRNLFLQTDNIVYRLNSPKHDIKINKYLNSGYLIYRLNGTKRSRELKKEFVNSVKTVKPESISNWRFARIIYIELMKVVIKYSKKYNSIVLPESYLNSQLKKRTTTLNHEEYILNDFSYDLKKDRKQIISEFSKKKGLHVIAPIELNKNVEILNSIFINHKINFYTGSKKEISKFTYNKIMDKNLENVISLEDFTNHKLFAKMATSFLLESDNLIIKLKEHYNQTITFESRKVYDSNLRKYVNKNKMEEGVVLNSFDLLNFLNEEIASDLIDIINYNNKYREDFFNKFLEDDDIENFKKDIISIADKIKLIDKSILAKKERIKTFFDGVDLIFALNAEMKDLPFIISYFKVMKKRLGKEHYNLLYKEYEMELYNESIEKFNYLKTLKKVA